MCRVLSSVPGLGLARPWTGSGGLISGHSSPAVSLLIDISLLLLTFLLDIIFNQLTQNVYQDGFVDGCNSANDDWQLSITKPPLLQRSRLTGGGSPNLVGLVERKAL